ncbi:MAG: terminase small subunit [Firmicutes bacterium]|nr:terminase small subunit [Bacillota bacterium]
MQGKNLPGGLRRRIRAGKLTREDVARRLAELAFGQANDCVKLVMEDAVGTETLDLSLLTELKRNDKGTVELRLVDRLRALEMLAELAGENGEDLESFLEALQGGGEGE